jgi:hypothetical protein
MFNQESESECASNDPATLHNAATTRCYTALMMCDPIADAACELLSFHGVVTARYISLLPVRQCATCHQPIATTTSQAASTVTAASKSKECVCVAVWFFCFLSRCSFILRLFIHPAPVCVHGCVFVGMYYCLLCRGSPVTHTVSSSGADLGLVGGMGGQSQQEHIVDMQCLCSPLCCWPWLHC